MAGPLGCAATTVRLQPRGGVAASAPTLTVPVGGVANTFSSCDWSRLLDDVSGAQLRIEGRARCCEWASATEPFRDELAVYRGNTRVWSGPVTEVHFVGDELRIDAKDLFYWMTRRLIHNDHRFIFGTDLATVFNSVVEDALSIDTTPNLSVAATLTGALIDEAEGRAYLATQHVIAMDAINELSRTGVDWTCIDRTVIVGGVQVPQVTNPMLLAKHFESDPEATKAGYDFGTRWHTSGSGRGDAGDDVYGTNDVDSVLEATYGVVERVASESFIRDGGTARRNALSRFALFGRDGVPRFIDGAHLTAKAPVGIADLIPGRIFRLGLGECPDVSGSYRLSAVNASLGPEHDWISLSMEPIGST